MRDPREFVSGWLRALETRDLDTFANGFAEDASAFVPFSDTPQRLFGRSAIRARFARYVDDIRAGTIPAPHFTLDDLLIQGDGDVRLATFTYAIAAGQIRRRTLALRREADGWCVLHLHGSNAAE
ncbi:MAG TPA: nuclear transport factor 2 family protein [Candidatus Limnocylindria bacterium]